MLGKKVSVHAVNKTVPELLTELSRQADFQFSYNSNLVRRMEKVNINASDKTVKQVLDQVFEGTPCLYRETGNYIILRKPGEYSYTISGYVRDLSTGQSVPNASVYEQHQLISTLTNEQGYFKLKLKDKYPDAAISLSKHMYMDTLMPLEPGFDQQLMVSLSPVKTKILPVVTIIDHQDGVEKTWLGRNFLSSRQKVQSLNIGGYFASRPFQFSIIPGVGTHGKMSGQVEDKFSFNVLGGYNAAVKGFELGTIFNIVKGDAGYVQIAGVFNMVGGRLTGVQIGGAYNQVLDSLDGVQIGGLASVVKGSVSGVQINGLGSIAGKRLDGVQIGGLYNQASGSVKGMQIGGLGSAALGNMEGMQIGGLACLTTKKANGLQISGLANYAREMEGTQIAGLVNVTRNLKGFQVAFLNIADTSSGLSIGFLNIVRKGYHKGTVFATDIVPVNIGAKLGTSRFYNTLFVGAKPLGDKAFVVGYGFGSEFRLGRRLSLNAELTSQGVYLGTWENVPSITRLQSNLQVQLVKGITVFGGPALNVCYSPLPFTKVDGYEILPIPETGALSWEVADRVNAWIGWQVGVLVF